MPIDRDIHNLLFQHDCVIVPGFGGFLTHYRPARLDEQRRLVHPPSKELSFNKHLVRQDGLLVDLLVRCEGVDFQAAKNRIEEEVGEWRWKLQRQGRLEVPQVGTFFHDHEQNLQFEPDRRVNFLKDAYGLRPVAAVPVLKPENLPKAIPAPLSGPEPEPEESRRAPAFLAAAAAVAILLTAATWWVVDTNGLKSISLGGFELPSSNEPARYVNPGAPPAGIEAPVEASIWKIPTGVYGIHEMPVAGKEVPAVAVDFGQAPTKTEPESTAVETPVVRSRYHIIGGCFLEKENADRFISELQAKGFAASLIDRKGGLYRVAYGSYPVKSTAVEALDAVRKEEAPDAWMLVQ